MHYVARLSGADRRGPFSGDGLRKPLRKTSVDAHVFTIRQAASAYVLSGSRLESITGLRTLVTEEAFRAICMFYWERANAAAVERGEYPSIEQAPPAAGVTSMTGMIAGTLLAIARHHCKLADDQCQILADLAKDMKPPRKTSISARNLPVFVSSTTPSFDSTCLPYLYGC